MLNQYNVVCFDLFYTLVSPDYQENPLETEYGILNLTEQEWEEIAEEDSISERRITGVIASEEEMMKEIFELVPFSTTKKQQELVMNARCERMKRALLEVDTKILETLAELKRQGKRLCLISNADVIDTKYWKESPLAPLFECTIFSHQVGACKPDKKIFEKAMERMHADASECVFVGDGGSNELKGAKEAGMATIFTEYLDVKEKERRMKILCYADGIIRDFSELLSLLIIRFKRDYKDKLSNQGDNRYQTVIQGVEINVYGDEDAPEMNYLYMADEVIADLCEYDYLAKDRIASWLGVTEAVTCTAMEFGRVTYPGIGEWENCCSITYRSISEFGDELYYRVKFNFNDREELEDLGWPVGVDVFQEEIDDAASERIERIMMYCRSRSLNEHEHYQMVEQNQRTDMQPMIQFWLT